MPTNKEFRIQIGKLEAKMVLYPSKLHSRGKKVIPEAISREVLKEVNMLQRKGARVNKQ